MLDDLLDSLDEMKQAIGIKPILTRLKEADRPKMAPANLLGYEYGMHSYIRTLAEIGKFLSPSKPLGPVTMLRLIRQHGLPARKLAPGGWMVQVRDLIEWAETFHRRGGTHEEQE